MTSEDAVAEKIKELASAVSVQAQASNRIWFGLVTVALISLLTKPSSNLGPDLDVALPFGFPKVSAELFYPLMFWFLLVLTIAFGAAHVEEFRALIRAIPQVEDVPKGSKVAGLHPHDFFDFVRAPSLNRVAPLPLLYRGNGNSSVWLRFKGVISVFHYAVLKLASIAVYLGIPAFAIGRTYTKSAALWESTKPETHLILVHYCFAAGVVVAAATLLEVLGCHIWYAGSASRRIWSGLKT